MYLLKFIWVIICVLYLRNEVRAKIRGVPGVDYPDYSEIPITSFKCSEQEYIPGFYADTATRCQVFHYCYENRQESFLCPAGTTFNKAIQSCDYWYSTNCPTASDFYHSGTFEKYNELSNLPFAQPHSDSNNMFEKMAALYEEENSENPSRYLSHRQLNIVSDEFSEDVDENIMKQNFEADSLNDMYDGFKTRISTDLELNTGIKQINPKGNDYFEYEHRKNNPEDVNIIISEHQFLKNHDVYSEENHSHDVGFSMHDSETIWEGSADDSYDSAFDDDESSGEMNSFGTDPDTLESQLSDIHSDSQDEAFHSKKILNSEQILTKRLSNEVSPKKKLRRKPIYVVLQTEDTEVSTNIDQVKQVLNTDKLPNSNILTYTETPSAKGSYPYKNKEVAVLQPPGQLRKNRKPIKVAIDAANEITRETSTPISKVSKDLKPVILSNIFDASYEEVKVSKPTLRRKPIIVDHGTDDTNSYSVTMIPNPDTSSFDSITLSTDMHDSFDFDELNQLNNFIFSSEMPQKKVLSTLVETNVGNRNHSKPGKAIVSPPNGNELHKFSKSLKFEDFMEDTPDVTDSYINPESFSKSDETGTPKYIDETESPLTLEWQTEPIYFETQSKVNGEGFGIDTDSKKTNLISMKEVDKLQHTEDLDTASPYIIRHAEISNATPFHKIHENLYVENPWIDSHKRENENTKSTLIPDKSFSEHKTDSSDLSISDDITTYSSNKEINVDNAIHHPLYSEFPVDDNIINYHRQQLAASYYPEWIDHNQFDESSEISHERIVYANYNSEIEKNTDSDAVNPIQEDNSFGSSKFEGTSFEPKNIEESIMQYYNNDASDMENGELFSQEEYQNNYEMANILSGHPEHQSKIPTDEATSESELPTSYIEENTDEGIPNLGDPHKTSESAAFLDEDALQNIIAASVTPKLPRFVYENNDIKAQETSNEDLEEYDTVSKSSSDSLKLQDYASVSSYNSKLIPTNDFMKTYRDDKEITHMYYESSEPKIEETHNSYQYDRLIDSLPADEDHETVEFTDMDSTYMPPYYHETNTFSDNHNEELSSHEVVSSDEIKTEAVHNVDSDMESSDSALDQEDGKKSDLELHEGMELDAAYQMIVDEPFHSSTPLPYDPNSYTQSLIDLKQESQRDIDSVEFYESREHSLPTDGVVKEVTGESEANDLLAKKKINENEAQKTTTPNSKDMQFSNTKLKFTQTGMASGISLKDRLPRIISGTRFATFPTFPQRLAVSGGPENLPKLIPNSKGIPLSSVRTGKVLKPVQYKKLISFGKKLLAKKTAKINMFKRYLNSFGTENLFI